jgi:nitrite reductase (NO-forming)
VSSPSIAQRPSRGSSPVLVAASIFIIGSLLLVAGLILASRQGSGAAAPRAAAAAAVPAPVKAAATAPAAADGSTGGMVMPAVPASAKARPHELVPAGLPAVGPGRVHHYTITLKDETIAIAPGVSYFGWTFDGTAPGPVIHVRQGDFVDVTLVNGGAIPHSIDFHAARVAPDVAFRSIDPKASLHFRFQANTPGAFMYHCGTPPVLAHIANGMYGAIIVDPRGGLPKVDHSYVLVASEWYLQGDGTSKPAVLDMRKARAKAPDFVTWNGYAGQYKEHPLHVGVGDTARFYVVSAGPSFDTDFHIVGTVFDRVWLDGTTTDTLRGVQTVLVPSGGGMVFDTRFDHKGLYPFVSHSFAAVDMGQLGLVNVGNVAGTMSH